MLDGYGRNITYMRLSVTRACNLRCRYCMPDGDDTERCGDVLLTADEMVLAVRAAASLGVTKLRVTGGEPLVRADIVELCGRFAEIHGIRELCLTTNGTLLPKLARSLREAGVSRINISLDTIDAEKYAYITRRGNLNDALAGLEAALDAGFDRVKLNAVLMGGFNDDEIPALAELTRKYPVDMRFIELMPMYDGGGLGHGAYVPCSRVLEALPELVREPQDGGVAELYRLPKAYGRVGLIRPISENFCAACNRIRLTADGKLHPCLHAPAEPSIKGLDMEGMAEQIRSAISAKPRWHGELSQSVRSRAGCNMNEIGG